MPTDQRRVFDVALAELLPLRHGRVRQANRQEWRSRRYVSQGVVVAGGRLVDAALWAPIQRSRVSTSSAAEVETANASIWIANVVSSKWAKPVRLDRSGASSARQYPNVPCRTCERAPAKLLANCSTFTADPGTIGYFGMRPVTALDRLPHALPLPWNSWNAAEPLPLSRASPWRSCRAARQGPRGTVSGIAPSLIDARQRTLPRHERRQAPPRCVKDGLAVARHLSTKAAPVSPSAGGLFWTLG